MQNFGVSEIQKDVIKTLAYADIFDYPLTLKEVDEFLIGDTKVAVDTLRETLPLIAADNKLIDADGKYFFLKGRNKLVEFRKKREGWSREKWKIARETADKLKIIPSIKMIGVTGALAMDNCEQDDDIDLIIITSGNCLWLTRLLTLLISPLLGIRRRKPKDKNVKDKICFNLFLDGAHLKIQPENLFLAHEICQIKPVLNRDNVYERFLWENRWVRRYLPNTVIPSNSAIQQFSNRVFIVKLLNCLIVVLDRIAYWLQYLYMKPKITCEKVSLHQAFFHPKDLNNEIERKYEEKIHTLEKLKN